MAKQLLLISILLPLIAGCQRSGDDSNDNFDTTPSTVATITFPTGAAATVTPGERYTFDLTISGINGVGTLEATLQNATGSIDITNLFITFSPLVEVGPFTFQTTGTVSSAFEGNGIISIRVVYFELGVIIFNNDITFDVALEQLSYRSNDTPIGGVGPFASSITVPSGLSSITNLRVQVHALADVSSGLRVTLVSPSATQIDLRGVLSTGGTDPNMAVIFDDSALLDITTDFAGNTPPPFIAFRPEEPLSAFIGEDPTGTWSLTVVNDSTMSTNTSLNEWILALNGDTSLVEPTTATPTALSFSSGSVGTTIDDTLPAVVSTISIPAGVPIISDLRLRLDVNHTFVGDLLVTLTSPGGASLSTMVTLSGGNGGAGDDMEVIFDDDALLDITTDFTGSLGSPFLAYRPEAALSTFIGRNPAGVWILNITDTGAGETGILNSWDLALNGDESLFADF